MPRCDAPPRRSARNCAPNATRSNRLTPAGRSTTPWRGFLRALTDGLRRHRSKRSYLQVRTGHRAKSQGVCMSFVSVTAELIEGAAQDLAGIRSSLREAVAAATVPTTGVAAAAKDEVSIALASLFGNFGQEFQAMSAQAQAFHAEFVSLMNAGAGAYLSAEAANVEQTLLGAATTSPAAPAAFLNGVTGFGATVAAPYQMLVSNTVANLQSLGG